MTTQPQRVSSRPDGVLARCVLSLRATALTLGRRYPLAADAALAAVILIVSLPPWTEVSGRSHALSLVLIAAIAAALIWRRRAPVTVCVTMTVLGVVLWFAGGEPTVYLALLVALYAVAVTAPVGHVLAAGAAAEAGAVLIAATKNGTGQSRLWVLAVATGSLAAAGFLGYYVRTARLARAASAAEHTERLERDREQQARQAVAAERARIARELHDIVAHNIAMMIALSDGAAAVTARSPERGAALMTDISASGRAALTEMRRLLGVLRQPAAAEHAPQPGLADLPALVAGVAAAGLPARLHVTGEPAGIPASTQLAVYRVVQEALTNTLKHAPGASAEVRLSYQSGAVELAVTDEGAVPGRAGGPRQPGSGHGIAGMRERAAVFGGRVSAGPRPGGGWRVHAVLPLGEDGGVPAGGERG